MRPCSSSIMPVALALIATIVNALVAEEVPGGEEVRGFFLSGKQEKVKKFLAQAETEIKAHPERDNYRRNAFILAIVTNALTYSPNPSLTDYKLSYDASKALVDQGIKAIEFQYVLTNYIAQDCNLFDKVDGKVYAVWRRDSAELFARMYESAAKTQDKSFDANVPISSRPALTQELLDKLVGAGVEFDLKGNPTGVAFSGELKKEYDAFESNHLKMFADREVQKDIAKLLNPQNNIVIIRFFTARYGRMPYNFTECDSYLKRINVLKLDKKDIICAISKDIQVAPPPELGIDCGLKIGEDGKF